MFVWVLTSKNINRFLVSKLKDSLEKVIFILRENPIFRLKIEKREVSLKHNPTPPVFPLEMFLKHSEKSKVNVMNLNNSTEIYTRHFFSKLNIKVTTTTGFDNSNSRLWIFVINKIGTNKWIFLIRWPTHWKFINRQKKTLFFYAPL